MTGDKIRITTPARAITFPEHVAAFVDRAMAQKPADTEFVRWEMGKVEHLISNGEWVLSVEWIPERNGW